VVDQDGDHFANELLNFVRAAQHIEHTAATERVLILGQRTNLHRPMGWLRGELEELVDRVLFDALHYHAAVTGRPLGLEFVTPHGEWPDVHSGYKLFTRATAQEVFGGPVRRAGAAPTAYFRHGVEVVMTVEALLAGATPGVVMRSTFNEQPISAFGLFNRAQLFADMVIWPCRRLRVPGRFVAQWLANHIPRLLLNTLVPQGREELRQVVERIAAGLPGCRVGEIKSPLFV